MTPPEPLRNAAPVPPREVLTVGHSPTPPALIDVWSRTGNAARRARLERDAEDDRVRLLGEHLLAQVDAFRSVVGERGLVRTRLEGRVRRPGPRAWVVRYWRCDRTRGTASSRHLYVGETGGLFESPDEPGATAARGELPRVRAVDVPAVLLALREVDARRTVDHVVRALADLLGAAGVR